MLMYAVENQNFEVVKFLLKNKANANQRDSNGYTPLHKYAQFCTDIKIAEILLSNGSNILAKSKNGWSVLHTAAFYGNFNFIKLVLHKPYNTFSKLLIDQKTNEGNTALHLTCEQNFPEIAKILLESGADLFEKTVKGYTALHLAVKNGISEIVKEILKSAKLKKIDLLNTQENFNIPTPLILAIENENVEMVKILLENNADPNIETRGTPLNYAIKNKNFEIVKLLLGYKSNINAPTIFQRKFGDFHEISRGLEGIGFNFLYQNGFLNKKQLDELEPVVLKIFPLHLSILVDSIKILKILLMEKPDITSRDAFGNTIFHYAVIKNNFEIIKLLLENSIDLNVADGEGFSPLHRVSQFSGGKIAEILIQNGANLFARDLDGLTPLIIAALNRNFEVMKVLLNSSGGQKMNLLNDNDNLDKSTAVLISTLENDIPVMKFLLENGADSNIQDFVGNTALHIAVQNTHLESVGTLLKFSDCNIGDVEGNTVLHLAVKEGNLKIMKMLLENGANPNVQNKEGATSLHLAVEIGNLEIVEILILNGADFKIVNEVGLTVMKLAEILGRNGVLKMFEVYEEEILKKENVRKEILIKENLKKENEVLNKEKRKNENLVPLNTVDVNVEKDHYCIFCNICCCCK